MTGTDRRILTNTLCARELYDWICENPNAAGVEIERLKGLISLAYHDEGTSLSENTFSIFRDELKGFSPKAPSHEPSGCPEHGMEHFFEGMCIKCGVVPAAKSSPPPSHGGRPMTLRECMDAEEPSACDHDLESPYKTLKATLAPRYGWRCTICKAEWYPERTNEQAS